MTEYLTEKLPFDQLLKASKTGGSILKAILKTAASEGLEEWANDYLNTLGNNFILGSESEMRQAVRELTDKGTSRKDAERQVAKEYLVWRPLQSALGGILAGGVVGGGSAAFGNYNSSRSPLSEDVNTTQTSADIENETGGPEMDAGIANIKKLPLANQSGSVYTGEKGTDILNGAAKGQGLSADGTLEALQSNPLWRTALEKVTGQRGTVPPMVSGYGPQTVQGSAGSLSSGDMAIIMLKKLTDTSSPLSQGIESPLSPHRIYNAYLETLDELDAALKSGMTAREYAMSKGVPSSLSDEDAAIQDAYEQKMRMEDAGDANPNGIKINAGKQDKHILGTNNYEQSKASGANRSILKVNPQQLLDDFAGTGQKIGTNKERVDFGKVIGQYYDETTGVFVDTTQGIIHYDTKGGAHIVPSAPK